MKRHFDTSSDSDDNEHMAKEWRLYPDPPEFPPLPLQVPRTDPALFVESALVELLVLVIDQYDNFQASEAGRHSTGQLRVGEEVRDRAEPEDLCSPARDRMFLATQSWLLQYTAALAEHGQDKISALIAALGHCGSYDPEGDWLRAAETTGSLRGTSALSEILDTTRAFIPRSFWTPRLRTDTTGAFFRAQSDHWFFDPCAPPQSHALNSLNGAWLPPVARRFLVLGDGNLARLPFIRDPRIGIHIFPGASLSHAIGILQGIATPDGRVERVLLSFGPAVGAEVTHQSVELLVNDLYDAATAKFPRAEILFALLPIGRLISRGIGAPMRIANLYLGMRPCVPPLRDSLVSVEVDGLTWSWEMGSEIWTLWSKYLF